MVGVTAFFIGLIFGLTVVFLMAVVLVPEQEKIKHKDIIMGMNPPRTDVELIRGNRFFKEYICVINHIEAPIGKNGEWKREHYKRLGVGTCIQFKDKETMARFGQFLVDFANGEADENYRKT